MTQEQSGRTLREIVRILAGRFAGMILILAIVLAGVAAATWFAPRSYRSEVRLLVEPSRSKGPMDTPVTSIREQVSLFVSTQREIIMSDYVVASALMMLDGQTMPPSAGDERAVKQPAPSMDLEPAVEEWGKKVQVWIAGQAEGDLPSHREYLAKVKKRVEVVTPGGPDATFSQALTIRVDWPEENTPDARTAMRDAKLTSRQLAARRAHEMAGLLVRAYRNRYAQLETERSRKVSAHYTEKGLADARKNLDDAFREYEKFTEEVEGDLLSIINLTGPQSAGLEAGVSRLKADRQADFDRIQTEKARVDMVLQAVQTQVRGINMPADPRTVGEAELVKIRRIVVPDSVSIKNATVTTVQGKITSLQLQLNNLLSRYKADYQEVKDLSHELNAGWVELYLEMDRIARRLEQERSELDGQTVKLADTVQKHSQKADDLAQKTAAFERLNNEKELAQAIYDKAMGRVLSAATAEQLAANPILVQTLDLATPPDPDKPRRPIVWVNLLVAGLAGLLLALVYAFLSDHFDHSIKSVDEAERILEAPVLASLPKLGGRIIRHARPPKGGGEPPLPRAWLKPANEDRFAAMWAALFYSGEPAENIVLVCSADRQEGASTIAAGLALAGSGAARVALVDLNLRNPSLHHLLGTGPVDGVAQIALEGMDPALVRQPINEGLDFYASGNVGPNALPLLRDEKLRSFLKDLAGRYDHVIVDAAPTNRFPDARVLATVIRDVVLVAHTEHTPRQAIVLARKHLQTGGARLAGLVLNLRTYPIPKFLYRRV